MGKRKPITPYDRLIDSIREWCFKAKHRHTVIMWVYPNARLGEGWSLEELAHRVQAAQQLGYDVQLVWAGDEGLRVVYKKQLPDIPYGWR